jgi:hypothetical protein
MLGDCQHGTTGVYVVALRTLRFLVSVCVSVFFRQTADVSPLRDSPTAQIHSWAVQITSSSQPRASASATLACPCDTIRSWSSRWGRWRSRWRRWRRRWREGRESKDDAKAATGQPASRHALSMVMPPIISTLRLRLTQPILLFYPILFYIASVDSFLAFVPFRQFAPMAQPNIPNYVRLPNSSRPRQTRRQTNPRGTERARPEARRFRHYDPYVSRTEARCSVVSRSLFVARLARDK